jgi:hypothetical protein
MARVVTRNSTRPKLVGGNKVRTGQGYAKCNAANGLLFAPHCRSLSAGRGIMRIGARCALLPEYAARCSALNDGILASNPLGKLKV